VNKKAIIVHPSPEVHGWVTAIKPDWDTQIPVQSISEVWDLLGNGTLSAESEIILFSDSLYETEGAEFAIAVAQFAPMALVVVISEDNSLTQLIVNAVGETADQYALDHAPFYFLDTATEDPTEELETIVANYTTYVAPAAPVVPAPAVPQIHTPTYHEAAPEAAPAPRAPHAVNEEVARAYKGDYTQEELESIENSLGEPGMVFSSTSSKGGSGKTTTAICTAITISIASRLAFEQGLTTAPLKVIVVDMDVRDGQIGFSINQTQPSVINYFVGEDKSINGLKEVLIHVPRFEIDTLLAPKRGRTADYLSPGFYRDIIKNLRLLYDVVILDTSVNYLDPLLSQVVYPESDAILFVTNLSKGAVFGMPRWMEEVTTPIEQHGAGVPKEKIGIVINQSMGHVGMDLDLLQKAAKGAPLLVAIPADSLAVVAASNNGTLNELISKHELIGGEYYKLATKIWRKSPLASPVEAYLNSPDKARDDALAAKGKATSGVQAPLGSMTAPTPPKKRFGKRGE